MILQKKANSLYYIIGVTFFLVVTLTMIVQVSYSYFNLKNQLLSEIKSNINVSSIQLQNTVTPFIDSFQVNEYENLIKNEIIHDNLLAIVVEDYKIGKILGKQSYITGVIKDEELNLIDFDIDNKKQKDLISSSKISKEIILKNQNNEEIGKLTVYGLDNVINNKLKELIINNIIFSISIYVISFLILYTIIKKFLVNPINNIVQILKSKDNDLLIPSNINEFSSKEFSYLSNIINSMTKEISDSHNKLIESNLRWQFAVDGSGDGLWDWNVKTGKVFFSKKWKEMLGFKEDEIKDSLEEWEKRVHPDDLEKVYMDINNYFEAKTELYKNEHRVLCKDKTYKWILDRGIIVERDDVGKPVRLIGTHTDITERIKHEKEMKQALSVFENTHDGIMITNSKNQIISINKAFSKTTGYKLEEIKYENPSILKSSMHNEDFYKDMWNSILAKGFWAGEVINKNSEGKLYTEYLTINVIKNGESIENFIGIFSDISILKQQEKLLLQQARTSAVGEMIGNIAHQWRQPLSLVSTVSTGMKLQLELGLDVPKNELVETFESINIHMQHLSTTIEDFRNFFRDDVSATSTFNISDTLQKIDSLTIDSFNNNFVIKNIDIEENIYVRGNQNLLVQALINIYNNSIDVLKEMGPREKRLFFLSVKKVENRVLIKIKDNAGGIDEEYLEKIFEPYFTTKHQSVGTGLGLYMTHQIITKQLKGSLTANNCKIIDNNKEYKGAEFTIILSPN